RELRPDLVTMDVHMPRMDGYEATKEIMIHSPTPIVIVTASLSARDVAATMRALEAGALTVLEKPVGSASPRFDAQARQLIATVKAMADVKVVRHHRSRLSGVDWPPSADRISGRSAEGGQPTKRGRARIIAIAASTGGPAALQSILSQLPAKLPVPIVVVQHISPGFIAGLAAWLGTVCKLDVRVARDGESLVPGTVYLAPEDRHLGVRRRTNLALSDEPPIGGFRPAGTFLFESVAKSFGSDMAAVILTGMGEDGVQGLRSVRAAGGTVIAQDEATSVVFGMPGVAITNGLVDDVLPMEMIARRLQELIV
ncbi:MAG: chemotaxis-specific protein-glutamate methyltransferase CheB, partial [Planctomycetaceae bacterium]|nr:chemotaxis-specific protein-glutamate methyltransferase CheB [Planctomycetaceae bacterium]